MITLYMTIGLPASGKTTWAKAKMAEHPGAYKRVNKDQLRAMLDDGKWSGDNEKFVLSVSRSIIDAALGHGKHVIVDDTNLHPKHETVLRECAKKHGAAFELVDFRHVYVEECIERDRKRPDYVGEAVIRKMHRDFIAKPVLPPVADPSLPKVILVDVDGTVAKMNGRDPFAWDRVGEDLPRYPVIRAICNFGYRWIFISGRDECCREATKAWLEKYFGDASDLYMRPKGDMRKDAIVKREIYEVHIQGCYNVEAIFDDRPQVIRAWEELGFGDRIFNVGDGIEF